MTQPLFVLSYIVFTPGQLTRRSSKVLPDYRELTFWCSTMFFGGYSRWLGWKLNWPPGSLGRRAIPFFAASMGCAATILLLSYDGSWSEVIRSIPQGLGAAAIIYGIYLGAVIEFVFWLPSVLVSAILNPTHTRHDRGKQCDELSDESTLR